jgi:hypothetical protein
MRAPFTIGFELEYEGVCFSENSEDLNEKFARFGEIKQDLSLSHGFELASTIESSQFFKSKSFLKKWHDLFNRLSALPIESTNGTGMHVHVGRKFLTDYDVIKLNSFIYCHYPFFALVGERKSSGFAEFYPNQSHEVHNKFAANKFKALNLHPIDTVEFRFFRTPTQLLQFAKNMQFVIACIEYVKSGQSVVGFKSNCKKYPYEVIRDFMDFIKTEDFRELNLFLDLNLKKINKILLGD